MSEIAKPARSLSGENALIALHVIGVHDASQIERDARLVLREMGFQDREFSYGHNPYGFFRELEEAMESNHDLKLSMAAHLELLAGNIRRRARGLESVWGWEGVGFTKLNTSIPHTGAYLGLEHGSRWNRSPYEVMFAFMGLCYEKYAIPRETCGVIVCDPRLDFYVDALEGEAEGAPEEYRQRHSISVRFKAVRNLLLEYASGRPEWTVIQAGVDDLEIEPMSRLPISRTGSKRFWRPYEDVSADVIRAMLGKGAENISQEDLSRRIDKVAFTKLHA